MISRHLVWTASLVVFVCFGITQRLRGGGPPKKGDDRAALKLPDDARVVGGRAGMPRMGERLPSAWNPRVDMEQSKGFSQTVYPKVAPAVVVVKLPGGHGTGFIVDSEGWVLTNNHVAADAAPDPVTGALTAEIFFGRLDGKWMKLDPKPIRAEVYKLSPAKDLALLKLTSKPEGMEQLPTVALAAEGPGPGTDCVAIGHPASSVLWSVREGQVTGLANWPGDMTDAITRLLSLKSVDADEFAQQLQTAQKRQILISNVGVNSGDSGGPLVNNDGKLIAITFAMPSFDPDGQLRQGTTSYHVHLDEVRDFLRTKPPKPLMMTDPWPDAMLAGFGNMGVGQGTDSLVFAPARNAPWVAVLIDLAGDNREPMSAEELSDPVQRAKWHFQFALHRAPFHRAFYDTRHTGKIDLVLTDVDDDGVADSALRLVNGSWQAEPVGGRSLLDPANFQDDRLKAQFGRVMKEMQK